MKRDNYTGQKFVAAVESQVVTVDVDGDGIDTRGFDSIALVANIGVSGDTLSDSVKIELEVEESDDDSTYTDVADADLINFVDGTNDGTFAVIDDPAEDDAIYATGYRGSKRYVRGVVNVTGSHSSGTEIGAVGVLGHAHATPVNAPT